VGNEPNAHLPTQMVNDKGRYRQLRARSPSPELFRPEPSQNTPNMGSSGPIDRGGTVLHVLKKETWDCWGERLYHS
jgi:hypothetical protein